MYGIRSACAGGAVAASVSADVMSPAARTLMAVRTGRTKEIAYIASSPGRCLRNWGVWSSLSILSLVRNDQIVGLRPDYAGSAGEPNRATQRSASPTYRE